MARATGEDDRPSPNHDVLIVGAGMAGLVAGFDLHQDGKRVLVVDKGRGVGGRLATRRIGDATFDHGAQFMTARGRRFSNAIRRWVEEGAVQEWFRTGDGTSDAHARWRGHPGMTAPAKALAKDLEVRCSLRVDALRCKASGWAAISETGESIEAGAVILTPPVPQSLELLAPERAHLDLDGQAWGKLEEIDYQPCIAVLAVLGGASCVPHPGGMAPLEGPIAWITDNQMKGISERPCITIHGTAEFSLSHWDTDRDEAGRLLIEAARPWLGARVTEHQVHGWRYAKPARTEEDPCRVLSKSPPLILAGDAFGGPRVEGAAISGWSAAKALRDLLSP